MDSVGIFVFSLKYIKDIYPMTILIYLVWIHCLLKMHSVQDEHPTVTSGQIRNSGINCVCVCVCLHVLVMRAYRGSRSIAPHIPNFGTR